MIDVVADQIIILVSSTLVLCYLGSLFYSKTKVPDIIWVLGFGILLGPVLGFFDKELFLSISPMMSTIALSIILFDAGINVDITLLLRAMLKSTILSVTTILSVMVAFGFLLSYVAPGSFNFLQGMLLGAMTGGTSTIAVFGVLSGLERLIPDIEDTKVLLMMESVISDPICIIASITIIRMIMLPGVSVVDSLRDIFTIFVLASLLGFVVGLIWSEVLDRIRGRSLNYMMTIAILFPTYIVAERTIGEGGGPMAALTFGLVIANYRYILRRIGINRSLKIDKKRLREFHEEITFLIKAFFFVYIGLIVTISVEYVRLGLVVLVAMLLVRVVVVQGVGVAFRFTAQEKLLSSLIYASGLPAFVMSQLPMIFDPDRLNFMNPEIYPNLTMPIVLGTVLFGAFAGPIIAKRRLVS